MRRTPERFAILDKVLEMPRHFTAAQLMEAMVASTSLRPTQATVYSTLKLLTEAQVLRQISIDGLTRYELRPKSQNGIYLICEHCGKIKTVENRTIAGVLRAVKFQAFTQDYYSLNIYGTCNMCARKLHRLQQADLQPININK